MNIFTRYVITVYTHMLLLMLLIVVTSTDVLYSFAQRTDALQVIVPKHCNDGKQSTLAEMPKATTAC